MKQYITVEQLEELTNKQYNSIFGTLGDAVTMGDMSRAINIGKMIEILDDKISHIGPMNEFRCVDVYDDDGVAVEYFEKELCDALWEAVKEVLCSTDNHINHK